MPIDSSNIESPGPAFCTVGNKESSKLGVGLKVLFWLTVVLVGVSTLLLVSGIPFSIDSIVATFKSIVAAIK